MSRIVLAGFSLIVLIACQPTSNELTEEQQTAIADSVRQLSAEMQRAFDNKDPSHFDYFADWSASSMAGRRSFDDASCRKHSPRNMPLLAS